VKTLHLLRHAKSDWSDSSRPDHDRPLNHRGKKARNVIARHVDNWAVDLVVCSSARRARDTASPVLVELGCPVRYDDAVYVATGAELLNVVRTLPDDVGIAMLVGHNPSVEELTTILCGRSPRYPTAALGTLELAIARWADANDGCGTLAAHVTPKELQTDD
jgi:phosphohistidine phosphatase